MKKSFAFFLFSLLLFQTSLAQVRLPRILRDSMILQRDAKVKLWGWAAPGEKVEVRFNKKTYKATTATDGKWSLFLQPTKAGGPYTININASNRMTLNNVLFGDVWVCAGQSAST